LFRIYDNKLNALTVYDRGMRRRSRNDRASEVDFRRPRNGGRGLIAYSRDDSLLQLKLLICLNIS